VTISCAEGDQGHVYEGILKFNSSVVDLGAVPKTKIMMNIASSDEAFRWWRLPIKGIGLARMEFIIRNIIRVHPMALIHPEQAKDKHVRDEIRALTSGYAVPQEYFVDNLARGIAKIAASQYPQPVIVRMSDFKTNEYANLLGGKAFEPDEENPMIGFRGASRYYSPRFREGFALECAAIKCVREDMGFENVIVMIPFCRTLSRQCATEKVLHEVVARSHRVHVVRFTIPVASEIFEWGCNAGNLPSWRLCLECGCRLYREVIYQVTR
jgi:pyruvate, water dikinase